jgi:hypothetical protein
MEPKNQVFNSVCEIITSEEFTSGQMNFHMKKCTLFDEDEENKHEYADIFEEYVKLVDVALDSELKKNHNEEDLD